MIQTKVLNIWMGFSLRLPDLCCLACHWSPHPRLQEDLGGRGVQNPHPREILRAEGGICCLACHWSHSTSWRRSKRFLLFDQEEIDLGIGWFWWEMSNKATTTLISGSQICILQNVNWSGRRLSGLEWYKYSPVVISIFTWIHLDSPVVISIFTWIHLDSPGVISILTWIHL